MKAMKAMKVKPGKANFIVLEGRFHMVTKEEVEEMLRTNPRLRFLVSPS